METFKEVFSAKNILLCVGSGVLAGAFSLRQGLRMGAKIGYDEGHKNGYQEGLKKGNEGKPMPEVLTSVGKLNYV